MADKYIRGLLGKLADTEIYGKITKYVKGLRMFY